MDRAVVLCANSLLFSNCTVFVPCNLQRYCCLFFPPSIVLKFQYWDFVILNRYLRPDKTHEEVTALKINLFTPLPWYCAVGWPSQDSVGFFWLW